MGKRGGAWFGKRKTSGVSGVGPGQPRSTAGLGLGGRMGLRPWRERGGGDLPLGVQASAPPPSQSHTQMMPQDTYSAREQR